MGWAIYDFITNIASAQSTKILDDVCPQFSCNMLEPNFDSLVDVYFGAVTFGFAADLLMHFWEGLDLYRVYKNPSLEGEALDIKQTKRIMYFGWFAVLLCDWSTIVFTMMVYFKSIQVQFY